VQTIEWSVQPADTEGPDGRISLRHSVQPGATVQDAIAVSNLSAVPATFTVTTGVGVVGDDVFDIDESATDGPAHWISIDGLEGGAVALAAGETRVLPVAVAVPADALPGDHPAGIAVGLSQGDGITVTHRVGIRLHLRVEGEISPHLAVKVTKTSFQSALNPFASGQLTIDYELSNSGNVRLGARIGGQLSGPFGLGTTDFTADPVTELLPDERVTRQLTVSAPALFWLGGSLSITPTVVGEDDVRPPLSDPVPFALLAVPWTACALVATLLALASWLYFRSRRAKAGRKPADELGNLADKDNRKTPESP
jgi:hypothetical protein